MAPLEPSVIAPGREQNRSQMLSPRPSTLAAPSTWYADVAEPHRKSLGNRRPASNVEAGSS
jgi:hypothetical protein